ncbi:hypothetical protein RR48_15470 [Papilio machaon]|uniref:Uncharacterized protein n=1 Tax=Papilio machaon TaxID=76193 RepID=A0A194QVH9_PAPMA|nr:hypothetical protein RR48_15470 [Papilio machaon]
MAVSKSSAGQAVLLKYNLYNRSVTNTNHTFGRELPNFAPIVACNSTVLDNILGEYRTTRDRLAASFNTYMARCDTEDERQRWEAVFAGMTDDRAVSRLRAS